MNEFFINIWSVIASIIWFDWLIVAVLLGFMLLGFISGAKAQLIRFSVLLLGFIVGWWFYVGVAHFIFADTASQLQLFGAFSALFIMVLIGKQLLGQLFRWLAGVANPCALNRLFALLVVAVLLGWFSMENRQPTAAFLGETISPPFNTILAFFIIWLGLCMACLFVLRLFNITVDANKSCLMLPFYNKLFTASAAIHNTFNIYNPTHIGSKIIGMVIGFVIGSLTILVVVFVFEHIAFISQQYYWIEAKGILRIFQDTVSNIRPILSQHLLFI